MRDFKTRAKELEYSNINYPNSDGSMRKMKRIQDIFMWATLFVLLSIGIQYGADKINTKPPEQKVEQVTPQQTTEQPNESDVTNEIVDSFTDSLTEFANIFKQELGINGGTTNTKPLSFSQMAKNWLSSFSNLLNMIGISLFTIDGIFILMYLINVVKRSREFERNIISNDFKAVALYRSLMYSLKINQRLREAKKSSRSNNNSSPTADSLSKIEELRSIKKLDVKVNTRQQLTSTQINTIYTIIIKLPVDETTVNGLLNRVGKLNQTATRLTKGVVTIGEYVMSEDRQMIYFQGETVPVADKYNYKDKIANLSKLSNIKEFFQSAYSISRFVDRSDEIDEKRELAQEWANRSGVALTKYLITAGIQVTPAGSNISSSKATFIYDLAHESSLGGNIAKLDEPLDKAFKLRGSSAGIINGQLEVVLPIPLDFHIPINVPTLYREAFGDVEDDSENGFEK